MKDPVMQKGIRILRAQEAKLYGMHILLCIKTRKDVITPDKWTKMSFHDKTVAAGAIKNKIWARTKRSG